MVSNKLMLFKLYYKTNKIANYDNNISYDIIYLFYLCNIAFKTNINSAPVLKYHGDIIMWCPEGK